MSSRHRHWIAGRPVEPATRRYLSTTNPSTRQPGEEIAAGASADAAQAVAAASAAWRGWAGRAAAERSAALHGVAELIQANADVLAELERACTGKTTRQLQVEISAAADYFGYYAGVLRSFGGRVIEQGAGTHSYTRLEPYGVVAVITPWNLPLNQAARAIAPAIAVGNAVVVKPSEFTSPSTVLLAALATEAGLPDGVLNVLLGTGAEAGAAVVNHPEVRRIAFTGSVATGRMIAAQAAQRLVPVTLELGGKSPIIVFADADRDRAIAAAVSGIQSNSGQTCSATTRLLVEKSVHDEIVAEVVGQFAALRPGHDFGPITTKAQYDKILDYFAQARRDGIAAVIGGTGYTDTDRDTDAGYFIAPTVYASVAPDSPLAQEEIFGPVLVTIPFGDEAEAVRIANGTDYGLVAAVWSGDVARGVRLAEQLDAGQVAVNGGALTVETPFGGYKNSGYGREKGIEALHDYAQVKTVSIGLR